LLGKKKYSVAPLNSLVSAGRPIIGSMYLSNPVPSRIFSTPLM
jgi:hypothetical protein